MAITEKLKFNKAQLARFAKLFKAARIKRGLTQLEVATAAFGYTKSHCKISRIERAAMAKVDAHCLERVAAVLGVPRRALSAVDVAFKDRAVVAREATRRGFWSKTARSTKTKVA